MKTTELKVLRQPNAITQARYAFSEYEMRVLLYVVKHIQDKLNRNDVEFNRNVFGEIDYKISFHLSDMMVTDGEKNHTRLKKALVDLRHRDFEVEDESGWFNVGFINYARHNTKTKKWELQVSFLLMPYLVSIAKGYTEFQLNAVLRMNTHTQRLYMMLSQFDDNRFFRIKADKLRYELGLESSYGQYKDFKNKVLKRSEKELKALYDAGHCDLYFVLKDDKKSRGGEDFDRLLDFTIVSNSQRRKLLEQAKQEYLQYTVALLRSIFPENEALGNKLANYMLSHKYLKAFADKLAGIEDKAQTEGKPLSAYGGLVRHIAQEDFKFKG